VKAETIPARLSAPWRRPSSTRRAALRFIVLAALGLAAWHLAASGAAFANVQPILMFVSALAAAILVRALANPGPRRLLALARMTLRRS
jgi:hypothetical protein